MPQPNGKSSPVQNGLLSPVSSIEEAPQEKVKLKKQLGLLEGVAIILGIIFGSGELLLMTLLWFVSHFWEVILAS